MKTKISEMTIFPLVALIIVCSIGYVLVEHSKKPMVKLVCFPENSIPQEIKQTNEVVYRVEPTKHPLICSEEHRDICHE